MIGERNQATRRQNIELGAGPSGLGAAFGRADQALADGIGTDCGRQGAGDGSDRAVEIEFADHDIA